MATSTPSVTPRLRVTRHPPMPYDRSIHTSTSTTEAVPSRLPDVSQLVNVTLNGIDMSDDNIYASDVPTEKTTPQAPPRIETLSTVTQKDNPAAVLRALLSRLPNRDGSPTRVNDKDAEYQYPSEKESDYDIETASATTSVAQSSLKNIFNKALREPGDTPRKDRSHRRRSSSIGATDMEDTPHVVEARDIKGKRRSLSDDEVESARESASKSRSRTRFKATPQPLTQEFLRKRFGEMANSPSNSASSLHSGVIPRLDSSQTTPPVATSTPHHSFGMSFENSQYKSNLLDRDSEMQNAIDALDSSTDNFSDRSVSPPPTLHVESELADDNHIRVMASKIRTVNDRARTPSPNAPTLNNKDSSVSASTIATRTNFGVYNLHDSLGERSMSLSLPAGHAMLQPGTEERSRSSLSRHRSLSHMHSASSLRPSSPLPGHYRSHTPVDSAHDKERNWNKPQPHRHDTPSPLLSRHSSLSSLGSISPKHHHQGEVVHERERNWNSPHPVWHNGSSPRHSRNHSFSSPRLSQEHSRPVTPVDPVHKRERNWNAPHPVGHDNVSPHNSKKSPVSPLHSDSRIRSNSSSHEFSHANGHHHVHHTHSPHSMKFQSTRPFSLHLPEKALRMSSPTPSHDHTHCESKARNALNSPSQVPKSRKKMNVSPVTVNGSKSRKKMDVSPVTVNGSKGHLVTPARTKLSKSPRSVATRKSVNKSGTNSGNDESDDSPQIQRVSLPSLYAWPALDLGHSDDSSKPVSNGRNQVHDVETDDLRETDVSSQSTTPKSRVTEPPEMPDSHGPPLEIVATSEDYGKGLLIQVNQDDIPPDAVAAGTLLSLSPPPQGTIRRSIKSEFKTPSPPKELSELPTPASSDNSRRSSPVQMPRMLDFGTPHQSKWMQTPKPPGGWLATPKPVKTEDESVGDDSATPSPNGDDMGNQHPRTPVDDTVQQIPAKTPKPPGGWALTPGPVSSTLVESSPQEGQLLTPVNSLSKGSTLNLKTPGVPGGWGVTPAKKGLLKVRFDPETPEIKDAFTSFAHTELHEDSNVVQADSTQNGLPPSPHSPRRVKANIRVLDAFGREESSRTSPKKDSNGSRNGIRVVDAKGREVKQESVSNEAKTEVEEDGVPPCRDELLSRLKQGLGNLVNDIDDLDNDREIRGPDYPRIEELVETSRQTRRARENLYPQIKTDSDVMQIPFVKPPFVSFSRKTCIVLVLAQIMLFIIYRVSITRARNLFFHAYYDPFNPELHLYIFKSDSTLQLDSSSTLWPKALLRAGSEAWATWFESVGDYREYIWQFWTMDIQQSTSWPPT